MDIEFMYRLRKAMNDKGINASDLSRLSGVGKSDISYYLKGKYLPKQDKCYLLAKALGVDPGWLMTGVAPKDIVMKLNLFAQSDEAETEIPLTKEAKIISAGIDKMEPERREQALKVLQTIFADIFDGGEKCGAQMVFADRLGVTQGTLTSKLQGHTFFTQPEIFRSMDILDIDPSEVTLYFFTI